jgi:hypothetical protein
MFGKNKKAAVTVNANGIIPVFRPVDGHVIDNTEFGRYPGLLSTRLVWLRSKGKGDVRGFVFLVLGDVAQIDGERGVYRFMDIDGNELTDVTHWRKFSTIINI